MEKFSKDWRNDIYDVFKDIDISLVSHIPDAGHTPLIDLCEKDNNIDVVTLTTEEEGVEIGSTTGVQLIGIMMIDIRRDIIPQSSGEAVERDSLQTIL